MLLSLVRVLRCVFLLLSFLVLHVGDDGVFAGHGDGALCGVDAGGWCEPEHARTVAGDAEAEVVGEHVVVAAEEDPVCGQGFAVVADEVRKLAERSTSATTEVSTLIGQVRQGVDEAVHSMQTSSQEGRR